jgi:hypothetical protein
MPLNQLFGQLRITGIIHHDPRSRRSYHPFFKEVPKQTQADAVIG